MSIKEPDSFKEQFKLMGLQLAKKAKSEVKQINSNKDEVIKNLNTEFVEETEERLQRITVDFLKEYETKLNEQISENYKQANMKIIQEKNKLFDELIEDFINSIRKRIEDNFDKYISWITKDLEEQSKIFDEKIIIQLNERDHKHFNQIISKIALLKCTLKDEPVKSLGGYVLSDLSNKIIINRTIEEIIAQKTQEFRKTFFKIFEKFVDKRKTATELMMEHDLREIFELPKEFNDFIKNKGVTSGN